MLTNGRNIAVSRRNIAISGKGGDFPGIGPLPTFWPFLVYLGTVMAEGV